MKRLLFILGPLLALPIWAQNTDNFVGACATQDACVLATNVSWATGNQDWRFTARYPSESIRIWILNHNPTTAHNSQAVTLFITDDATAPTLLTASDRWVQAAVIDNSIAGAQCANVAASAPLGAPGVNGKATCYSIGMYTTQAAVRITGAVLGAGSPDTFDIGIVQQPSTYPGGPQPGSDSSVGDGIPLQISSTFTEAAAAPVIGGRIIECALTTGALTPCIPTYYSAMMSGNGINIDRPRAYGLGNEPVTLNTITGIVSVGNWISDGILANTTSRAKAQSSVNATAAANSTGTTLTGIQIVTGPAGWTVPVQAATASQCSASVAASATTRHCAIGVTACFVATAAQTQLFVNLRDGATGAGTVKWNGIMADTVGLGTCITQDFSGGPICGTINTAMTLELSAATAATNGCATTLRGYDVL